jgi:hypothetical protein
MPRIELEKRSMRLFFGLHQTEECVMFNGCLPATLCEAFGLQFEGQGVLSFLLSWLQLDGEGFSMVFELVHALPNNVMNAELNVMIKFIQKPLVT